MSDVIKDPLKVAKRALVTLHNDRDERLLKIDDYYNGRQDLPYTPELADEEYKQLAHRAITNVMQFMVSTPAQMMYVDSFRRGRTSDGTADFKTSKTNVIQPEWDHWQNSRLDARQAAVMRGALKFGHSFVLSEKVDDKVLSKGLSALNTVALFRDPATDDDAYATLTVMQWPDEDEPGLARMFDETYEYSVRFKGAGDDADVVATRDKKHGAKRNPVTRFAAAVDLEGRTCGVVEPMFILQDRINQTVFDLLIVQSYASFKVRTVSGMTPPFKVKPIDDDGNEVLNPHDDDDRIAEWVPVIGANGRPVPDEVNLNAKRVLIAKDTQTKFGTLDETPLDGFIKAIELAFRHMAALSQTPPHHILGDISNLSADALNAAESSLLRKVSEFKSGFGESWERVFRVAAEIGEYEGAQDLAGEVIWRDVGNTALSQTADALGKLSQQLMVPPQGLWGRIPGVTATEIAEWTELKAQETPEQALASATRKNAVGSRPTFRASQEDPNNLDPGTAAA